MGCPGAQKNILILLQDQQRIASEHKPAFPAQHRSALLGSGTVLIEIKCNCKTSRPSQDKLCIVPRVRRPKLVKQKPTQEPSSR